MKIAIYVAPSLFVNVSIRRGAPISEPKDIPGAQSDVQSSDSPAESPPKTGAKGPPKKGGKAGKGPPLPGTTGELCAVPDAAASAVPEEASHSYMCHLVSPDNIFLFAGCPVA